jgi:hypothetical protein
MTEIGQSSLAATQNPPASDAEIPERRLLRFRTRPALRPIDGATPVAWAEDACSKMSNRRKGAVDIAGFIDGRGHATNIVIAGQKAKSGYTAQERKNALKVPIRKSLP